MSEKSVNIKGYISYIKTNLIPTEVLSVSGEHDLSRNRDASVFLQVLKILESGVIHVHHLALQSCGRYNQGNHFMFTTMILNGNKLY